MVASTEHEYSNLLSVIQQHWGFQELRPLQEPAMRAVLDGAILSSSCRPAAANRFVTRPPPCSTRRNHRRRLAADLR